VTSEWLPYFEVGSLIFAAGIFYAGVRRMGKHLNGVRRIVNENRKQERKRFTKLLNTLRVALPEEHREKIIEMLPEDDE
jgi:hypothetical protein